jgi:glutamyl-tRNA reductase
MQCDVRTKATAIQRFARGAAVVGLSHRTCPIGELANFSVPPDRRAEVLEDLRDLGLREVLLLSTCNRVEVAFIDPAGRGADAWAPVILQILQKEPRDLAQIPYFAYDGGNAVNHLFEVAASVDSLVIGERQILGQLRDAFALAVASGTAGPRLRAILHASFRAARRVRREASLSGGSSVVTLAIDKLISAAEQSRGSFEQPLPVALVGTGAMTQQAAAVLSKRPGIRLLFVNRTVEKAQDLARHFAGSSLSLERFLSDPPPVAAVMTATSSRDPVFRAPELSSLRRARLHAPRPTGAPVPAPLCVVDLAVPFDVDPAAAGGLDVALTRIDDLRTEAARRAQLQQNEIDRARQVLASVRERLAERAMADAAGRALGAGRVRAEAAAAHAVEELQSLVPLPPAAVVRLGARACEAAHRIAHATHSGSPDAPRWVADSQRRVLSETGASLPWCATLRVERWARRAVASIVSAATATSNDFLMP